VLTFSFNFFYINRLDEDAPASLPTLLRPLGILLKEALDQTEQNDNSYQVNCQSVFFLQSFELNVERNFCWLFH